MQPKHDNPRERTYDELMAAGPAHIIVKIDTERPIELGAFISAFTSVANQYDKFVREKHAELAPETQIFVKEVKRGSIIADLIPFLNYDLIGGVASVVDPLEQIRVIDEFVREYGLRIKTYISGKTDPDATRSDLKDLMGAVTAIANDPDGSTTIEAVYFEDRKKKVKAAVTFKTREARRAVTQIEQHQALLERRDHADHERVLMIFKQANETNRASIVADLQKVGDLVVSLGIPTYGGVMICETKSVTLEKRIEALKEALGKKGIVAPSGTQTSQNSEWHWCFACTQLRN